MTLTRARSAVPFAPRRRWCRFHLLVLAMSLACWPPAAAHAQLAPARTYYLKNGRIEITVTVPLKPPAPPTPAEQAPPREPAADGEPPPDAPSTRGPLTIALHREGEPKPVTVAPVLEGKIDLATIFPRLWSDADPVLLYAQLREGDREIGPPLVLQPMVSPARATQLDTRGIAIKFTRPPQPYYSGLRIYVEQLVVIDTSLGQFTLRLRPDAAPNTVWNFRELVRGGLYAGTPFHRVSADGDPTHVNLIQGGDPLGDGTGGPGFAIDLERSPLPHAFGVVSMARQSHPDSAGSQFFIGLARRGAEALDGAYASFAQVVSGGDVIRAMAKLPVGDGDRPIKPPTIRSAALIDAPPIGQRPKPEQGQDDEPGR